MFTESQTEEHATLQYNQGKRKLTELLRVLRGQSLQRKRDRFTAWLGAGWEPLRNDAASEGIVARSRQRELYEFCKWVKDRDAYLAEVLPHCIVAADGPEKRVWEPEGGLCPEHWPYLKPCCGPEDGDSDEVSAILLRQIEIADTCRNEIIYAVLSNQAQNKGFSYSVATAALNRVVDQVAVAAVGPFWKVVDDLGFGVVIDAMEWEAATISTEFREVLKQKPADPHPTAPQPAAPHPNGPDEDGRTFWWRGKPYRLSRQRFALMSILWAAPDHSLRRWEVIKKLYPDATAASKRYEQRLRDLAFQVGKAFSNAPISVHLGKDRLGYEIVRLATS